GPIAPDMVGTGPSRYGALTAHSRAAASPVVPRAGHSKRRQPHVRNPGAKPFLFVIALAGLAPWGRCAADEFDAVRAQVRRTLVRDALPSMAVAVAAGGEVLWEEGFGWADREGRVPATEHTLYPLASISKPITATALMVLRARG